MRRCSECGGEVVGRLGRLTCSARCRVARSRRLVPGTIERTNAPVAEGKRVGGFTSENEALLQRLDAWQEGDNAGPLIRWAAAHLRGERR